MLRKFLEKLFLGKVDPSASRESFSVYCANQRKNYENSLDQGITDQEIAYSAVNKLENKIKLSPNESTALTRIKRNFPDVFKENNSELVNPIEEEQLKMDNFSVEAVGQPLQHARLSFKTELANTVGLSDWNRHISISRFINTHIGYNVNLISDSDNDIPLQSSWLGDID